MAMMVSYTMFSYLAVTEREIKDQAAVKKPEFRDTQIVNLSFYVLMSLMTGLFIAGYFLSWLGKTLSAYLLLPLTTGSFHVLLQHPKAPCAKCKLSSLIEHSDLVS